MGIGRSLMLPSERLGVLPTAADRERGLCGTSVGTGRQNSSGFETVTTRGKAG